MFAWIRHFWNFLKLSYISILFWKAMIGIELQPWVCVIGIYYEILSFSKILRYFPRASLPWKVDFGHKIKTPIVTKGKKRITLSLVVENVIWFVGKYLHCLAPFRLIPKACQKFESAGVNWYCRCLTWTYEYQLAGSVFRKPKFKGIIIWLSIVQCLVCTVICILQRCPEWHWYPCKLQKGGAI